MGPFNQSRDTAIFAAGCFWGVELEFRKIPGVVDVTVGYSGGHTPNPSYQEVCTDKTGHAEVAKVMFDASKVTYQQLLDVFWIMHDPTTLNRQGPDIGSQYRSVIFYVNDEQKKMAEASKKTASQSGRFTRPIVTEIVPEMPFFPAEEYHQRYLEKKGITIACH